LSDEPNRCRKLTAPMRAPAGAAALRHSSRWMLPMKMRSTRVASAA